MTKQTETAVEIPQTAEWWFKQGKDASNLDPYDRLFYMEQAYNHLMNALIAATRTSSPSADDEKVAREAAEKIVWDVNSRLTEFKLDSGVTQKFAAIIASALTAAREPVAEMWRPISTAPKDGRTLLLGYPNQQGKWRIVRGQWFTDEMIEDWDNADDFDADWYETSVENDEPPNCWLISPTHWMPLPAGPQEKMEDGK